MKYHLVWLLAFAAEAALADTFSLRLQDQSGQPLADAVAILTRDTMPAPQPRNEIINQIGETFVPRVSVMPVGSSVNFPNQDQILHHIYSFSAPKTFEVPLYAGTPAEPILFDQPGMVILGCNIHDWMQAWVLVTESPWAAKTGEDGALRIDNLEPGAYQLEIWHPEQRRPLANREINVRGDTSLQLSLETRPAINLRSVPRSGSGYF